jgi:hypothetical protein
MNHNPDQIIASLTWLDRSGGEHYALAFRFAAKAGHKTRLFGVRLDNVEMQQQGMSRFWSRKNAVDRLYEVFDALPRRTIILDSYGLDLYGLTGRR